MCRFNLGRSSASASGLKVPFQVLELVYAAALDTVIMRVVQIDHTKRVGSLSRLQRGNVHGRNDFSGVFDGANHGRIQD